MFAVIARFPAARDHQDAFNQSLQKSLEITRQQPGLVAYQVLAPRPSTPTRVCLMLWRRREDFQTFVKSEASQRAHADVRPEHFDETPVLEQLDVLETWHAEAEAAT
ncbi:MAG: antibiotic biosynthesis monooxygenase [Myxococcales bacterium]|nr:antibiotic biosynthesis monooxygenase [Myxococcales bacterium]